MTLPLLSPQPGRFTRLATGALLLAAAALSPWAAQAQNPNEYFRFKLSSFASAATTTFDTITQTKLPCSDPLGDEGFTPATALPFPIVYNGVARTHFVMCSNGWMKLGDAALVAPASTFYAQEGTSGLASSRFTVKNNLTAIWADDAEAVNILSPFNMDLEATAANGSNFSYSVTGTAPNRVITFRWKDLRDYSGTAAERQYLNISFQVAILEAGANSGGNVIQFRYGAFQASANPTLTKNAAIGLRGNGLEADNVYHALKSTANVATAWGASTGVGLRPVVTARANPLAYANAYATSRASLPNTAVAGAGRVFTWTPTAATRFIYSPINAQTDLATYTEITTGGGATDLAVGGSVVSAYQSGILTFPPGFTFVYNGVTADRFVVNGNGYVKIGDVTTVLPAAGLVGNAYGAGALNSVAATNNNILAPLNIALVGNGAATVLYQLTGIAPNRVFTVQYKNFRDAPVTGSLFGTAGAQIFSSLDFQIRLLEGNRSIQFIYNNFVPTALNEWKIANMGIKGASDLPNQSVHAISQADPGDNFLGADFANTNINTLSFVGASILSNTSFPQTGLTHTFNLQYANDLQPTVLQTLGKLPIPEANPVTIGAVIRNVGLTAYASGGNATLTISQGGVPFFTDVKPIPNLAVGERATVTFDPTNYPALNGNSANTIVRVTVPFTDDNVGNDAIQISQDANDSLYSYKYNGAANVGGVGFTGGSGVFVAKIKSTSTLKFLKEIQVDFQPGTSSQYRLVVYTADVAGKPSVLQYISPTPLTRSAAGGTAKFNICPALTVSNDFFVGVQQFNTVNIGFAYQNENPPRPNTFFYTFPFGNGGAAVNDVTTAANWTDFSPDSPFRFAISARIGDAAGLAPAAVIGQPGNGATFRNRNVTLSWTSGGGNTEKFDVYLGLVANPGVAQLVASGTCATSFVAGILAPGTTYFWKVVPKNPAGTAAITVPVWSFTTAPNAVNDDCPTAVNLVACNSAITGFTANSTSSGGTVCNATVANDDVWYKFSNGSATSLNIVVTPTNAPALTVSDFDAVIQLRGTSAPCTFTNVDICQNIRPAGVAEVLFLTGLTPNNVYYLRVYGATAIENDNQFTIQIQQPGGWIGTASTGSQTNWSNAGNWCDGLVPSVGSSVTVPNSTNKPVLSSSVQVLNLTLQNGATLTIPPGLVLRVQGDGAVGNGSFTSTGTILGDGILALAAAAPQPANNVAGTFNARLLRVENTGAGVNFNVGSLGLISRQLIFQPASVVVNNGTVVLTSTATNTASIPAITGAVPTYSGAGLLAQQRYVAGSAGRWLFVGSPTRNGALNFLSTPFNIRRTPENNANFFSYQETDSSRRLVNGSIAEQYGWRIPGDFATTAFNSPATNKLNGYRVFARSSMFSTGSLVFATGGNPYFGTTLANLTNTPGQYDGGGWNLVTNPYMSDIDWNSVGKDAQVNNAFFIYNGVSGRYQVYVGAGGSLAGVGINVDNVSGAAGANIIPSSQAIFVKALANNVNLTFNETSKASAQGSFVRQSAPQDQLRIKVANATGKSDECVIRFATVGTEGFDAAYDAGHWPSDYCSVSSQAVGTSSLSVNTLPTLQARKSVWLRTVATSLGTYTLNFSELETFTADVTVTLVDHLLGINRAITSGMAYSFAITSNPATQGDSRFEVVFAPAGVTSVQPTAGINLSAWPNPASAGQRIQLSFSGLAAGPASVQILDLTGRQVATQAIQLDGNAATEYTLGSSLAAGQYTVRVIAREGAAVSQLIVK